MAATQQLLASYSIASGPAAPEVLWWKCNNGSGTTVTADVGPNGTFNGTWATGASGSGFSLEFNGTSQDAFSASSVNIGANVATITAWLNMDDYTSLVRGAFQQGVINDPNTISVWVNSVIRVTALGTTGERTETFTPPSTGSWVFMCFLFDSSTASGNVMLYYNAVEQTEIAILINTKTGTSNFSAGTFTVANYAGFYADGKMDDIRIYNRLLGTAEISALYAAGSQ